MSLKKIRVKVPSDCQAGDTLDVLLSMDKIAFQRRIWETRMRASRKQIHFAVIFWLVIELISMCFLGFGIGLNTATLDLSECDVVNPKSGKYLNKLYLSFFSGLSNLKGKCSNTVTDFCYAWGELGWNQFEEVSGSSASNNNYYVNTRSAMHTAQVLIPMTLVFLAIATVSHSCILIGKKPKADYPLFFGWVILSFDQLGSLHCGLVKHHYCPYLFTHTTGNGICAVVLIWTIFLTILYQRQQIVTLTSTAGQVLPISAAPLSPQPLGSSL